MLVMMKMMKAMVKIAGGCVFDLHVPGGVAPEYACGSSRPPEC